LTAQAGCLWFLGGCIVGTDSLIKKAQALLKDSKRLERGIKVNLNTTAKIVERSRKRRAELRTQEAKSAK
jgi:hypothetical protein